VALHLRSEDSGWYLFRRKF